MMMTMMMMMILRRPLAWWHWHHHQPMSDASRTRRHRCPESSKPISTNNMD